MTWHTVVVLEIQQHVRICRFVDNICIIDLLEPRQTTGNHQRPMNNDTVRRRLITNTIRCRRPTRKSILAVHRRQERLQWTTMQRQNWRHYQWTNIILLIYCNSIADGRNKGVMNASTVACIMERYSWREPNIIVWSGIGISFKLGPVIFQNIGQCRGNGVMGALYTKF